MIISVWSISATPGGTHFMKITATGGGICCSASKAHAYLDGFIKNPQQKQRTYVPFRPK
jgi:hypothetical protein